MLANIEARANGPAIIGKSAPVDHHSLAVRQNQQQRFALADVDGSQLQPTG